MHVIDVRELDANGVIELCRRKLSENYFISVSALHASSFSFITSTRLANLVKKERAEVIVVDRLRDAIAAVSARKLVGKDLSHYKIVYAVSSLCAMPHGVPTEVCRGIDCWVFDSKSTEQAYCNHEFIEVHRSVIIPPTTSIDIAAEKNVAERDTLHVTVVGDLAEGERLQRTVRAVAACERNRIELHVYGTGKARTIMPIVNEARHLDGLSVVWHGSTYDLTKVIADTDIAVGAHSVADNVDIFMRSLSIPVVEPEKIAETVASAEALKAAGEASLAKYNSMYNPEHHVNLWSELIKNLA